MADRYSKKNHLWIQVVKWSTEYNSFILIYSAGFIKKVGYYNINFASTQTPPDMSR